LASNFDGGAALRASQFPDVEDHSGSSRRILALFEAAKDATAVLRIACDNLEDLDAYCASAALYLAVKHSVGRDNAAAQVAALPSFACIMGYLRTCLGDVQWPRSLAQLLWALGKVETQGPDAEAVILHTAQVLPRLLGRCSSQELSNSVWGLSKLTPVHRRTAEAASTLANSIVAEGSRRIQLLTPQCLSNSLWAITQLRLKTPEAEEFARLCVREICQGSRDLSAFSPQCLANILWAAAKLAPFIQNKGGCGRGDTTKLLCQAITTAAEPRMLDFQPQELSMLAWSVAKLQGRAHSNNRKGFVKRKGSRSEDTSCFLAHLAEVACSRLSEFTPQGISNIAWALATADVLGKEEACRYMTAAALDAAPRLADFPPQAISNLCWAVSRVSGSSAFASTSEKKIASQAANALAEAAAQAVMYRVSEFGWQDLSGVIVALGHSRHRTTTTQGMATQLVILATNNCHKLSTQVMLNIAMSATRLSVQHQILRPLVVQIGGCIAARAPRVSPMDLRQWAEVQNRCPAFSASCHGHANGGHLCYM
jgi:hypothetical protein